MEASVQTLPRAQIPKILGVRSQDLHVGAMVRNIRAPEILTFDELYQRASCIVENISREGSLASTAAQDEPDDVPF